MMKLYAKILLVTVFSSVVFYYTKSYGYEWFALWILSSANFVAGSWWRAGIIKLGKDKNYVHIG